MLALTKIARVPAIEAFVVTGIMRGSGRGETLKRLQHFSAGDCQIDDESLVDIEIAFVFAS